ncbi:MAG: glycosyltransferase family 4 protein [Clostridia bacterium]|nr:glycosyltransferase family 4 protein [Clostridia bacterium]
MKVLFINHAGVWGGASVSMEHILEALSDAGHTVEVVNRSVPSATMDVLNQKSYRVYPVRWGMSHPYYNGGVINRLALPYWSAVYNIFRAEKEMDGIIAKSDADLVIVNSMTLFYMGKIAKKYGKKAICFQRETFPDTVFSEHIRKKMAASFDMIVYISQYDKNQFDRFSSVHKRVIYDKINLSEYAALPKKNIDETGKSILFLGGIRELKGTHIALLALKQLPEFRLNIVSAQPLQSTSAKGKAAEYQNLCSKLADETVKDRIRILPPTKNVAQYYAEADVVLFTPTIAHQSRLIYEAGAACKPIVVPNMKNLSEFCYEHVFCYDAKWPETCAAALKKAVAAEIDYNKVQMSLAEKHDSRTLKDEIKQIIEETEQI